MSQPSKTPTADIFALQRLEGDFASAGMKLVLQVPTLLVPEMAASGEARRIRNDFDRKKRVTFHEAVTNKLKRIATKPMRPETPKACALSDVNTDVYFSPQPEPGVSERRSASRVILLLLAMSLVLAEVGIVAMMASKWLPTFARVATIPERVLVLAAITITIMFAFVIALLHKSTKSQR